MKVLSLKDLFFKDCSDFSTGEFLEALPLEIPEECRTIRPLGLLNNPRGFQRHGSVREKGTEFSESLKNFLFFANGSFKVVYVFFVVRVHFVRHIHSLVCAPRGLSRTGPESLSLPPGRGSTHGNRLQLPEAPFHRCGFASHLLQRVPREYQCCVQVGDQSKKLRRFEQSFLRPEFLPQRVGGKAPVFAHR